jgi:hypothetical protein
VRVAKLAALGLCAAATACSDGDERPPLAADLGARAVPITGCEEFSYRTCDIVQADCQTEIFELMRCAYGMSGESATIPPITLVTKEEALDWFSSGPDASAAGDPRDFAASIRALEGLGMIEAGMVSTEDDLLAFTLEGVLGLYLDTSKEILIIDQGESTRGLYADTTLGHELVHALQDQRHDLTALAASVGSSVDAQLGVASLIEGEATFYELRMLLAYQGQTLADVDFAQLRGYGDDASRELGSPALTARSVFPYTYGASYVAGRWQAGGRAALDAEYDEPPADTLEIVQGATATREPIAAVPEPLDGYVVVEQQTYGAWLMAATVAGLSEGSPSDHAGLAAYWRGDQLSVYRASDGDGVVADWAIRARDRAAAERLADAYELWRPPGGELALRVDDDTLHVVVSAGAGGAEPWLERWGAAQ